MNENSADETDSAEQQTNHIRHLERAEVRDNHSPDNRANSLHGEDHAHPVFRHIGSGFTDRNFPMHIGSYGAVSVGPHKKESRPTEELHQSYSPESRRSLDEQLNYAFALFIRFFLGDTVIFGIFGRRIFLNLESGVNHAENQDSRTCIEAEDNRIAYHAGRSSILDADVGEHIREKVSHERAGVAEERLDAIGLSLLFLVDHVAHHHLEGLHGNVDACVEEHKGEQTEKHSSRESPKYDLSGEAKAAGIRQEAHHSHGDNGTNEEIWYAATETSPCFVGKSADDGLHNHTHKRRKNPEKAKCVRIGTKSSENAADVGALQGVGNLHAEESETYVPEIPKRFIRYLFHFIKRYLVCYLSLRRASVGVDYSNVIGV